LKCRTADMGFDMLDHTAESRNAVEQAIDRVLNALN
jgi:hypothetical protein